MQKNDGLVFISFERAFSSTLQNSNAMYSAMGYLRGRYPKQK
jgi:hypothetical protein